MVKNDYMTKDMPLEGLMTRAKFEETMAKPTEETKVLTQKSEVKEENDGNNN